MSKKGRQTSIDLGCEATGVEAVVVCSMGLIPRRRVPREEAAFIDIVFYTVIFLAELQCAKLTMQHCELPE
ncbi:MAG: hypothetical protein COA36_17275 [Desulfotalea sp.]|nr:MAG: hypothetical protein COA36_17275 [Desulfotalea sp.]